MTDRFRLVGAVALGAAAVLLLDPAGAQQRPGITRGAGSAGVEKEPTFRFTTFDGRPSNSDCDRNVIKVPPSYGQAFAVTTSGKQAVLWFRSNDGAVRNVFITDDQVLVTVVPSN